MSTDTLPDEPKKSLFEKLGAGLPIGLTALATILAGLSTGELSRAMYWRSTAAQDQAKANDQWSLAGFKRDRALMAQTTADTLTAIGGYRTVNQPAPAATPEHVVRVSAWLGDKSGKVEPPIDDPAVSAVLQAVHHRELETEVVKLARKVDLDRLEGSINAAAQSAAEVDKAFESELKSAEALTRTPAENGQKAEIAREEQAVAVAARYSIESRRYRAEATANQWVGFLYEVRVKTSTAESERHRKRSENFFFAMLAAQIGGVGSSLALARKRKSVLWLVAGIAGLAAIGFGAFVYLTM